MTKPAVRLRRLPVLGVCGAGWLRGHGPYVVTRWGFVWLTSSGLLCGRGGG